MKIFFLVILSLTASILFAAPLDRQFSGTAGQARQHVINSAAKYENTPYLYGGMSLNGMDCSGFIYVSFREALGISLPRSASALFTWAEDIALESAQPGDLLFFRTTNTRAITHVGLYLGNGRFIHSASHGSPTGVIYSNLSETYWARAYAGAGRALPEAPEFKITDTNNAQTGIRAGSSPSEQTAQTRFDAMARPQTLPSVDNPASGLPAEPAAEPEAGEGRLLLGAAIAPTWNAFYKGGDFIRGFASHLRLGIDTNSFGMRMIFGLEIRPEYDGALGVFRIPITLSWGPNDQIRIFGGPVLSFGDASLSTDEGERSYTGGTTWFGTVGITAAPFIFETEQGEFAPYIEVAWQSYFRDGIDEDLNADFSAGFRFSTGLRWTIQVK